MNSVVEIGFYVINLLVFYGILIPRIGARISEKCNNFRDCKSTVRNTWYGLQVDIADGQWREFRNTLPLLCMAALLVTVLHLLLYKWEQKSRENLLKTQQFNLIVGVIVLIVQHGWHCGVVLSIICVSYMIGRFFQRSKFSIPMMWLFACSIIALKESYRIQWYPGYEFLSVLFNRKWSGLYAWHVPANFLVLRLISFHCDYHWAICAKYEITSGIKCSVDSCAHVPKPAPATDMPQVAGGSLVAREVAASHRPLEDYSILNCISYCVYAPLYVAGPIVTFNTYMEYCRHPQKSENVPMYFLRWVFSFGLLEVLTSFFPFFSVVRVGLHNRLTPSEMAVLAYVLLKMMWMKFLVIWRFFRLWALADGMWVPENMTRCMSNNCSLEQFWKGWHASFNLWLVRYMYKPMGGRKHRLLNVWVVFLFVAIWHDIEMKLLVWGALNSVFFVIEVMGRWIGQSFMQGLPSILRASIETMSSAAYIIVLIAVNLVGYAIGTGGVHTITLKMMSADGIYTVFGSFYFLIVGVCIMNWLKRHRISL